MASLLLGTRGQPVQGGSCRVSPLAAGIAGELGSSFVGKEAAVHLSPIFSIRSEAKTAGGISIAHSSKSLCS